VDDGGRLGAGLVLLLAGDLAGAAATVAPLADAADPTHRLLGQLLGAVLAGLDDRLPDVAGELGRIALEAEFAGLPWVERMSRGLAEAFLVAGGAPAWRAEACDDVREECERAGDPWGAAALRFALASAFRVVDPAGSAAAFADAADRFGRLDAPVPATWCEVLRSAALTGGTDAGVAAPADTGVARSTQPPHGTEGSALRGVEPAGAVSGREPPPMEIRCFGPFALEIDGVAVDLDHLRPRARAVLRMLAMAGGCDVHQERLVDAFWPGADYPVGVRRLQVALSSVRQVLERCGPPGLDWLHRRDNSYRLALRPGSRIDLVLFEEQLATARATTGDRDPAARIAARLQALELYRGELLPEDGAAEHVVDERDRFRVAAAEAATALAADLQTAGRLDEALVAAARSVRLEPFQDAAWRQLAALHEETGDATAALRVRLQHARVVAELSTVST
jgi:DNA-binding SARP family transcriptional activator